MAGLNGRHFAALQALLACVACPPSQSPDLETYLDAIRRTGMSEAARDHVGMVASVMTGATLLSYEEDQASGRYWTSYASSFCPLPGADPEEVRKITADLEAGVDGRTRELQPLADLDSSGFVSSEEGRRFRDLVEFAWLSASVTRKHPGERGMIVRALGITDETFEARLADYKALRARAQSRPAVLLPETGL